MQTPLRNLSIVAFAWGVALSLCWTLAKHYTSTLAFVLFVWMSLLLACVTALFVCRSSQTKRGVAVGALVMLALCCYSILVVGSMLGMAAGWFFAIKCALEGGAIGAGVEMTLKHQTYRGAGAIAVGAISFVGNFAFPW